MRGLKFEDLLAIVDFLYYGEANIYQENLDTFLNIAEELNLKGLSGGKGGREDEGMEQELSSRPTEKPIAMSAAPRKNISQPQSLNQPVLYKSYDKEQDNSKGVIALPKEEVPADLKKLDEMVNSMMNISENMVKFGEGRMAKGYVCQVCGKEGQGNNIKYHIETNHLEGISIPCNICDQTFRARKLLTQHKAQHHTNSIC